MPWRIWDNFSIGVQMQVPFLKVHGCIDRITGLPSFSRRLIDAFIHVFQNSRFLLHAFGKLRRLALVHFQKEFVLQQFLARQGTCRQCGTCCNLLFTCPMLTRHGGCITYGKCRPQACKAFPIDQRDIDEIILSNGQCGFYFTGEPFDCNRITGRF